MNSLFALSILPEHVLIAILAVAVTFFLVRDAVRLAFRVDDRMEEFGEMFQELTTHLASNHMHEMAAVTSPLGNRDFTAAVGRVRIILERLKDPAQAALIFNRQFLEQIPDRLKDDTVRVPALKAIADWAVANPEAVKAAGLAITVATKV